MTKFIGKGVMQQFSQEVILQTQISVANLPRLLQMPQELEKNLIVVRDHRKLDENDLILNNDEIYLYLAVMGG